MIATPYGAGARMLRKGEIARIHGHSFPEDLSTALSCEMSGQGVMVRVFNNIFQKLATFLQEGSPVEAERALIETTPIQNEFPLFA